MARRFRLWGKKRGERRTVSRLSGNLGEAVFFGSLFLLGFVLLTVQLTTQAINVFYQPGFGFWLAIGVLASFMVIGGGGLMYAVLRVGASIERRSAMAKRAADIDLIQDALPSVKDYPNVPHQADLTDSPGVMLAYRLPSGKSSAWSLLAATLLALLATGFATVLAVIAVESLLIREPEWYLILVAVPYVALGSWSVYFLIRQLWLHTGIGPTCVEISDLPLRPGREYAIFLSQGGRLSLSALRMTIVCEEEATYSQGTDIRTEKQVVYESPVFLRESIRIEPGVPFEVHECLRIPPAAMHSFQSGHNAVRWRLVVDGKPVALPRFSRTFPLVVYPNVNGSRQD